MKKILLISPFPPAQNPRLLKEYECLKANQFDVKVLYAERDRWAAAFKPIANTDFILVGGAYGSFFYYLTRVIHKLLRHVLPLAYGYDKASWLLYFKALSLRADLYIGHNLATLPIVVKLSKKTKSKCGFDAEDFHRNEVTDDQSKAEFIIPKRLEDEYIEQTDFVTAASPLICRAYQSIYPKLNPVNINNVLSIEHVKTPIEKPGQASDLKLFWFSQTIGRDRGLEVVIKAMGLLNTTEITLTLLGSITPENKTYFDQLTCENGLLPNQLIIHAPVSPEKIFELACQHDVGLALELDSPYNRDICLTNKIFTYVTAGLAIIASETTAQKAFLLEHPQIGKSYSIGKARELASIINQYRKNKNLLNATKVYSTELAKKTLNWEKESKIFMALVEKTLEI
ncbi:MAG: hypothetical protein EOO96_00500 [Pedobacter sp.]|nr:MAG: hypothetical protein EOO96_00500 [Pedobacter sp.]